MYKISALNNTLGIDIPLKKNKPNQIVVKESILGIKLPIRSLNTTKKIRHARPSQMNQFSALNNL